MLSSASEVKPISLHARFDPIWNRTRTMHVALQCLLACVILSSTSLIAFYLHWGISIAASIALFSFALSNPVVEETPWTVSNPKGTFTDQTKRAALVLTFCPILAVFAATTYPDSWHGAAIAFCAPSCLFMGFVGMYMQASSSFVAGGGTRYKFD